MTILEKLKKIKARVKIDYYINIFDNRTEYTPDNFGFYINDLEEFSDNLLLQNELKHKPRWVRSAGKEKINIPFN